MVGYGPWLVTVDRVSSSTPIGSSHIGSSHIFFNCRTVTSRLSIPTSTVDIVLGPQAAMAQAMRPQSCKTKELGRHIYVYNNLRTNQVVYSLSRTLQVRASCSIQPGQPLTDKLVEQ